MSAFLKLKKRKDFVRAAKIGEKVITTSVILQAAQSLSPNSIEAKFGFTTTKKIGKAHVRNRARRRMRAIVRELAPQEALNHTEYVLIGRRNTAECDFNLLRQDLKYAFRKINRLLYGEKDEKFSSDSVDMAN